MKTKQIQFMTALTGLTLLSVGSLSAQETVLHNADTAENVTLTWGAQQPDARLEVNRDPAFISEGSGSLHARATSTVAGTGTSYIGFRIPVTPFSLDGRALEFAAWSSQPQATTAFYARALNAEGKIVAGWTSWSNPLSETQRTFTLIPGIQTSGMGWESSRIQAEGEEVCALEFIAGSKEKGKEYDMFVDHVRAIPAPEPPPQNWVAHGVPAPVGMPTWGPSTIATLDADGRRIVFIKLWTGSNASYLFIDAETGQTEQVQPGASGWGAYQVLMSPEKVIYDTMGQQLVAIDVDSRRIRPLGALPGGMALSYMLADDGRIFAGIYPSATLVSYDPASDTFTNHGALNEEQWPQYPRPLVMDAAGWVYCAISIQAVQIAALNPETGEKRVFIPQDKRQRGNARLFKGTDGQVYAFAESWGWHQLAEGRATPVEEPDVQAEAGRNMLTFPDGSRCVKANVPDRELQILDAGADTPRTVHFDYQSTGVNLYTIIAGPDGAIHGATGIPLRIWRLDPETGALSNRGLGGYGGHINQFVLQGDKLYGAVYSSGRLLEYDPSRPYDDAPMHESKNPRLVHDDPAARDLYGRPHAVLAHPDGRHVLVGGCAARVVLGSGLLIYDCQTETGTIVDRADLIPDQGINALAALPGGDVVVGTTTRPPTAGSPGDATTALVYRFNLESRQIVSRWPLQPDCPAVRDLLVAPNGLVYGLAEPDRFFVLDPERGTFTHQETLQEYGGVSGYQAPRCMTLGPDGMIYAIFRGAVVRIDPDSLAHEAIARPDTTITSGIAILDDRLYFGSGPRLFSCSLTPEP